MAKRVFSAINWTPVPVADAAAFTDGGYMALLGTTASQRAMISEVNIGGLATASAVTALELGRDSTLGASLTALASPNSDGPMNSAAAQTANISPFVASTTKPQRSNATTVAKLPLSFNAWGGTVRWVAAPGSEWFIFGNATTDGETSLSCANVSGAGAVSADIIYEPL